MPMALLQCLGEGCIAGGQWRSLIMGRRRQRQFERALCEWCNKRLTFPMTVYFNVASAGRLTSPPAFISAAATGAQQTGRRRAWWQNQFDPLGVDLG